MLRSAVRTRAVRVVLTAVLALAVLAPVASAGSQVSVRVEGRSATLLPQTAVTLPDAPITLADGTTTCPADSAAAALDVATGRNWDRTLYATTILGESEAYAAGGFWSPWVNDRVGDGLCSQLLEAGDDLVLIVADANAAKTGPIAITAAPATAQRGSAFAVTVTQYLPDDGFTVGASVPTPLAGATVSGGGASAVTDAAGHATLTLGGSGSVALRASAGFLRSAPVAVCVHDGNDGTCGTSAPPAPQTPQPLWPAVAVHVHSPQQDDRFSPKQAPRKLSGSFAPSSVPLATVAIRLSRWTGRCSFYSVAAERFRPTKRCDHGKLQGNWYKYKIGQSSDWSYLLPAKLGLGRYALEVIAITDHGARSSSRLVFWVTNRKAKRAR